VMYELDTNLLKSPSRRCSAFPEILVLLYGASNVHAPVSSRGPGGPIRPSQAGPKSEWVGAAPAKLVCMWRGPNPTTKWSHLIQLCTSTFSPVFHSEKCLKIILDRLSGAEF